MDTLEMQKVNLIYAFTLGLITWETYLESYREIEAEYLERKNKK